MHRNVVIVAFAVLPLALGVAVVSLRAADVPPVAGDPPVHAVAATTPGPAPGSASGPAPGPTPPARPRPLLVVIGASFSAAVGADSRGNAWPEVLTRTLGWRLAVSADPGAGYVNPGLGHRGPFARLAADLDLRRLNPTVVIVQGGHDDIGQPPGLVSARVTQLIQQVRAACPRSKVDILTVFSTGDRPSPAAIATDTAIVTTARRADPGITVFDPLTEHWRFPRIHDQLHPSPAGHRWIADQLVVTMRRQAS
ncbi:MAG: SGNH/GDSL hydrolase family protein [Pseudonocardia sp.]|nr:SGNH/GDSL hydrolase family protein [Pseudonocardia sp.]